MSSAGAADLTAPSAELVVRDDRTSTRADRVELVVTDHSSEDLVIVHRTDHEGDGGPALDPHRVADRERVTHRTAPIVTAVGEHLLANR